MTSTPSESKNDPSHLENLQQQLVESLKKAEQAQIHAYIAMCEKKLSEYQKQKQKLELCLTRTNLEIRTMELSIERLQLDLKKTNIDPHKIFYTFFSESFGRIPGFHPYNLYVNVILTRTPNGKCLVVVPYTMSLNRISFAGKTNSLSKEHTATIQKLINFTEIQHLIESRTEDLNTTDYELYQFQTVHALHTITFIMYIPDQIRKTHNIISEYFFENPVNFSESKSLSSSTDNNTELLNDVD